MNGLARFSPALALIAFFLSISTAVAVALDRFAGWSLVRGKGDASPEPPFEAEQLPRIMFPRQQKPDSPHSNHMISLAYNWDWDMDAGWARGDLEKPSVALTLESWYYGLAELNLDMRPPTGETSWPGGRAMGFAARHDGTYATLTIGGTPYNANSAGIKLTGGLVAQPIVALMEGAGTENPAVLQVSRADGQPSVVLRGGTSPALAFGLSGEPADRLADGILRFSGVLEGVPLINVAAAGSDATVLAVRTDETDTHPRIRVSAEGRIEWSDGSAHSDVALSRDRNGRLVTEAELAASKLSIGGGETMRRLRVIEANVEMPEIEARSSGQREVAVPGVTEASLVFASPPVQPRGIGFAGAQIAAEGAVALSFVNVSDTARRPAAGPYLLLVIETDR